MVEEPVQRFYWPENAIDWPEPAQCDMRGDTNFKNSDSSDISENALTTSILMHGL